MMTKELADEYTDTNANPYADGTANNEPENLNTKTVKKGDKIVTKYGWIQQTWKALTIFKLLVFQDKI